jgi:hypothetical protein
MGFSNDANKLEEVFLGEIKEVNLDNSSNRIEVVAQGYGAELVARIKGTTEDETAIAYKDTFDLLAHLMFSEEVVHFGKRKFDSISMVGEDQSIERNATQYKETFGSSGLWNMNRPGSTIFGPYAQEQKAQASVSNFFSDLKTDIIEIGHKAAEALIIKPYTGPQDDNIFAPNFTTMEAYTGYDWARKWTGGSSFSGDYKRVASIRNSNVGTKDLTKDQMQLMFDDLQKAFPEIKNKEPDYPGKTLSIASAILGGALAVGGIIALMATGLVFAPIVAIIAGLFAVSYSYYAKDVFWRPAQEEWRMTMLEKAGYLTFDWIEAISTDSVKYNIFYSTIWDIFEEMTYRHVGYVKHPRIYYGSNRMTMFFGLPDQNMWSMAGDPLYTYEANTIFNKIREEADSFYASKTYWYSDQTDLSSTYAAGSEQSRRERASGESMSNSQVDYLEKRQRLDRKFTVNSDLVALFLKITRRRFKPFRRWHNINSYTDIISNDIQATGEGWYTEVELQYSNYDSVVKASDDASIKDPNSFVDWDNERVVQLRAHTGLEPGNIRKITFQFPNCKSRVMAKRYARSILGKQAKEMYKGSVLVMGSPYIRPYDVCIINDTYNNIYGPIEVEEVHHMFSPESGYVTQIYPDTFVVQEDMTPYVVFNSVNFSVYMRTEKYIQNTLEAYPIWGGVENYSSAGLKALSEYATTYAKYSKGVERSWGEISKGMELAADLVDDLAETTFVKTLKWGAIGLGVANLTTFGGTMGGVWGAIAGAAGGIGIGVMLGQTNLLNFYASAKISEMIINYMTESKAYFMIPLLREGIPMLGGYNIQHASAFYKSPITYMRQFWSDGATGLSTVESDLAMRHANIKERNGGEIGSWLANAELSLESWDISIDKFYINGGDKFIRPSAEKIAKGKFPVDTVMGIPVN